MIKKYTIYFSKRNILFEVWFEDQWDSSYDLETLHGLKMKITLQWNLDNWTPLLQKLKNVC